MIKEITKYATSDNSVFDNYQDAIHYEHQQHILETFINDILPELDINTNQLISARLHNNFEKLLEVLLHSKVEPI